MKKHESTPYIKSLLGALLALACCASFAQTAAQTPETLEQGNKWNNQARNDFYSQDQGSRLIPLKWIRALKHPGGEPFLAANLDRYGYLPNPASPSGLPIGFTTNTAADKTIYLGMTCAACHTRQIDVAGTSYRIDGGPAIIELQSFQTDLDAAVNTVLNDATAFDQFAAEVLGGTPTPPDKQKLRDDLTAWFVPFHAITGSLPAASPWGPARADCITLIFNRVSGLDIGPPPTYMIPENIKPADVPVRFPFLWNAWRQDFTQWPGFAPNGNKLFGLSRNTGEVIGVFALFHPFKDSTTHLGINYSKNNSANFSGLNKLEDLMKKIGPPKWPWALDKALVARGKQVYKQKDPANGNQSCESCHGIKWGKFRSLFHTTWATPIVDVGTDSREVNLLDSQVKTGVLEGASIFGVVGTPLKPVDSARSVLVLSVAGSILQNYLTLGLKKSEAPSLRETMQPTPAASANSARGSTAPKQFPYESRVMEGIWAAAPYLHNGSVPTLMELLTPDSQRVANFMIGPAYDINNVGLAVLQTKFNYTLRTTDCSDRNSGNSRCGHNYGTTFSAADKKALLEYLKSL